MSEKRPSYWDKPAELRPPNWRRLQAEIYAEEERVALPAFRDDALAAYTAHLQALRRPQPTKLQRLIAQRPELVAAREWPEDCELASRLEAFVLARHSDSAIGKRLCLPLESVTYYINVNFDTRPFIDNPAYVHRFGIERERERGNPETASERELVKYLAYYCGPSALDSLFDGDKRTCAKPWIQTRAAVAQLLGKHHLRRLAQIVDRSGTGDQFIDLEQEEAWIDAFEKFMPTGNSSNIVEYYARRQSQVFRPPGSPKHPRDVAAQSANCKVGEAPSQASLDPLRKAAPAADPTGERR